MPVYVFATFCYFQIQLLKYINLLSAQPWCFHIDQPYLCILVSWLLITQIQQQEVRRTEICLDLIQRPFWARLVISYKAGVFVFLFFRKFWNFAPTCNEQQIHSYRHNSCEDAAAICSHSIRKLLRYAHWLSAWPRDGESCFYAILVVQRQHFGWA